MPVSTLNAAPTIELDGLAARPMAVPSRGSSELAIWYLSVEPGVGGKEHTVDREEVFLVRSGRLHATLAGERCEIGPGDALIVPPGVPFAVSNDGDTAVDLVVCTSAGVLATMDGRTIAPPWAR